MTWSSLWCFILSLTGHSPSTGAWKGDDDYGDITLQCIVGFQGVIAYSKMMTTEQKASDEKGEQRRRKITDIWDSQS